MIGPYKKIKKNIKKCDMSLSESGECPKILTLMGTYDGIQTMRGWGSQFSIKPILQVMKRQCKKNTKTMTAVDSL